MFLSLIAALLLQAPGQEPRISHERIGEGQYRLRLVAPGLSEVGQGQALLVPEARRLCAPLLPVFGHYRWDGAERVAAPGAPRQALSLTLEQDVACSAAAPPAPAVAAPDPTWQPSPAAEQAVRAATSAYFAAKDSGRYAEAHAMLTGTNQAMAPLARWSAEARAFNAEAGAVRGRRLIRLTWYNNPPSAPVPGIYAAVDFDGDFAGLHFLCGYVIWLRQADGSWRLAREEQYMVARASAPDATPEQLAALRPQIGCRD